jgi:histidine triad (HIT) family protein
MATTEYDGNCSFCTIARGQDSGIEVVAEDVDWIAFFPLNPATPGHTLVIPRAHVRNLWDADLELASVVMRAAVLVGRAIDTALKPQGMNLITSDGRVAEQTVFHLHLHLVPRWQDDGFGQIWPIGYRYDSVDKTDLAGSVKSAFSENSL